MDTMQIVHLCISGVSFILVWALVFQRLAELRAKRAVQIKHIEIDADSPDRFAMAAFKAMKTDKE